METIQLTGILLAPDKYKRLRLALVNTLSDGKHDNSYYKLCKLIHPGKNKTYCTYNHGRPNDADMYGECWITVNGSKKYQQRILTLVEELRGQEVTIIVHPVQYSLISTAAHNEGTRIRGISLKFKTLTKYE